MKALSCIFIAIDDLAEGLKSWELWTSLGWNELQKRFRRSVIGPLWMMLNLVIFVVALGFIYAEIMNQPLEIYIPHLVLGMAIWTFISSIIMEGSRIYVSEGQILKQVNLPKSVFLYVLIWRNLIIFAYQFFVFILILALIEAPTITQWLFAILGFALTIANCAWMGLLIAVVSARYHDVSEILGNILRIAFFITPIIWMPASSLKHSVITDFNPFYHLIEITRAYLLGGVATSASWIVAIISCVAGWLLTLIIVGRYKNNISFWI